MSAQASVELLMILSVIVVVFGITYAIAQREYQSSQVNLDTAKARNALRTMRDTGTYVYSQGEGASSRILVSVPGRIESSEVSGNYLRYRMDLSGSIQDIVEAGDFCMGGSIPSTPGSRWVTVESNGTCILFAES